MRMGLVLSHEQFNKILNKTSLKRHLIQYTTLDDNDIILILNFISNKLIEKDWRDEYFDLNSPEYISFLLKAMDFKFDISQDIKEYLLDVFPENKNLIFKG